MLRPLVCFSFFTATIQSEPSCSSEPLPYLLSCVDKAFFGADLCGFPIQHIGEFSLKLRKVLLSFCFIWHLGIFPDQPDTHSFWRGIVFKNVAVDRTGKGML